MGEQSDDEFWDECERLLQEGYEEETPKDKQPVDKPSTLKMDLMDQSPIQPEVNLPFSDSDDSDD